MSLAISATFKIRSKERSRPPRAYYLLNRREHRLPVHNWSGEDLDEIEVDRLIVGDCVRLIVESSNGLGWEGIYFEIIKIDYYSEGGIHRPRKFYGKAMDTYRCYSSKSDGTLDYIQTGEIITFQRKNVFEIPGWKADGVGWKGVGKQRNIDRIEESLAAIRREGRRRTEEYWDKK